jgi:hypothetical protein
MGGLVRTWFVDNEVFADARDSSQSVAWADDSWLNKIRLVPKRGYGGRGGLRKTRRYRGGRGEMVFDV